MSLASIRVGIFRLRSRAGIVNGSPMMFSQASLRLIRRLTFTLLTAGAGALFASGCQSSLEDDASSPSASAGSVGVSGAFANGGAGAGRAPVAGVPGFGGNSGGTFAGAGGAPGTSAGGTSGTTSAAGVGVAGSIGSAGGPIVGAAGSAPAGAAGGPNACAANQTTCGDNCVSLDVDNANCGACGNACITGQRCEGGQCRCAAGLVACAGACVDTDSNGSHCGACGTVCPNGQVCNAGACTLSCAGNLRQCGQECVNVSESGSHCGNCNVACPAGQTCGGGQCACPSGQNACNGQCVNTATNGSHCGACNTACGTGQSCQAGVCTCPSGQTRCGAACLNTQTDAANCGTCGRQCASGMICSNGTCSGGTTGGRAFSQCRFHFGTIDSRARNNAALVQQLDYFIPGWLGQANTFDMQYVCTDAMGQFSNLVPAVVGYVIAFKARRDRGLQDCNVSGSTNLCRYGATFIRENRAAILDVYRSYAQGFARCLGTTRPILWFMEPDYYQYHSGGDAQALSPAEAGQFMTEMVTAVRQDLPNAVFSLDISPWVGQNGRDHGQAWFSNFNMSLFTFINTSGGGTHANNARIRSSNEMTWAGVHGVTGKPILADTGYGVAGTSTGHDAQWDSAANINARIANGVAGIAQYNPNSSWANTISQIRPNLSAVPCY